MPLADKRICITLCGGEPALNPKFALELMQRFPLLRFMGEESERREPRLWFGSASAQMLDRPLNAEVYEFREVRP